MNSNWTIRPLTRTRRDSGERYLREPRVEAQLRRLTDLPERSRRAALLDEKAQGERLQEESLVYALREATRCGDDALAWLLAERLIARTAGHVARQLKKWRLPPDDADDCTRDLVAALLDALFDPSPAGEFWEVRFWVCLDRRLWNLIEKRQGALDAQLREVETSTTTEGEEGESLLARLADPDPGPEALAERQAALALLTENERLALYLTRVEGLPEESDDPDRITAARILGVTGRSVRNYLRRAEEKLRRWQQL